MTQLMNIRNQIIDGLLQSRIQPLLQKYNQPRQTGLLNFVNSPQAQDIATGLLAQSGYSTMPQSFGQSLGVAMQNANDRAMARDASELDAISTFADIQNLFVGQDQKDKQIGQTDRSLDLEEGRTESTIELQGKQGGQIDSNIEINEQEMNLKEKEFNLNQEKFNWAKNNPEATSTIGGLVQDFNRKIITEEQLELGLKDVLGTEGTTDMRNYQYIADYLFDGDIEQAILFDKSSKSKSKDDYISDWISDAKNESITGNINIKELRNEAEFSWAVSKAKIPSGDKKDNKKGDYYFITLKDNTEAVGQWNGEKYEIVKSPK
tara:strand:- start:3915 stop:4874 length:960 start_codon:yes stop_codon:yes gene_type:complete